MIIPSYQFKKDIALTGTETTDISTEGLASVIVDINGTWTGTVLFKASIDGTLYEAVTGANLGLLDGVGYSSATANGCFQFGVAGFRFFRVQASSINSGSPLVRLGAATASNTINAFTSPISTATTSIEKIKKAIDCVKTFTWSDFGTSTQRVASIAFTSATVLSGHTATLTFAYTLVSSAYRLDTITWSYV